MNLYIVPEGATDVSQAIANGSSTCFECTTEHLFVPLPGTGKYEIWVERLTSFFMPTDYALSWWSYTEPDIPLGDFDGNGITDEDDYTLWASSYGSTVTPGTGADGNGDGAINAADYTVWRDAYSAASVPVPEPAGVVLAVVALLAGGRRRVGSGRSAS